MISSTLSQRVSIVIALAVLIFSGFYTHTTAYAQTFTAISNLSQPIKGMAYQPETDSIWVLSEGSGFTWLYQVDRATRSLILSVNHTKTFDDLSAGRTQDIWCGKTDCYITTSGGLLARIPTQDLGGGIFKGRNVTATYSSSAVLYHITGRDQVNGGFGSVTLWIDAVEGADHKILIVDGISMLRTGVLDTYASGVSSQAHDIRWSKIEGSNDNDLIVPQGFITDTGAQDKVKVYNLASLTTKCTAVLPSGNNPLSVAPNYVSAGNILNKFYVSSIDGLIYVYDDDCTLKQTVSTGLTGDLRFIDYQSGRVFVQENGANARIMQLLTNSSGHIITSSNSTYFPLPSVSQDTFDSVDTQITFARFILLAGNGQLWFPYTGSAKKIGTLIYSTSGTTSTQVCIDVNPSPDFTDITCFTDTNGDGIPDSQQGYAPVERNITESGYDLGCQLGITDCNNPDSKTNGIGYMILLMIITLFSSLILGVTWKTNHDPKEIPSFVWFIIILASTGITYFAHFTDGIPFFVSIVAIIALGAVKLSGRFGD